MTKTRTPQTISLNTFAEAVGCHFTTASRLRAGTRMPGRDLFNRIVDIYGLDRNEAMTAFCGSMVGFGEYLQEKVFDVIAEDVRADQAKHGTPNE